MSIDERAICISLSRALLIIQGSREREETTYITYLKTNYSSCQERKHPDPKRGHLTPFGSY
jgi:hypothetical protein